MLHNVVVYYPFILQPPLKSAKIMQVYVVLCVQPFEFHLHKVSVNKEIKIYDEFNAPVTPRREVELIKIDIY